MGYGFVTYQFSIVDLIFEVEVPESYGGAPRNNINNTNMLMMVMMMMMMMIMMIAYY